MNFGRPDWAKFLLGVVILCNCWSTDVWAQASDPKGQPPGSDKNPPLTLALDPPRVTLIEENPNLSPNSNDRHYTNGAKMALTSSPLQKDSTFEAPFRGLRSLGLFYAPDAKTDERIEWTVVGQSIFTAENHERDNPDPKDRPFAGWLYAGLKLIQVHDDKELTSFEILGGVVGPSALGEQVENGVHDLFRIDRVKGWDYQLHDEPAGLVAWDRKWRFNHEIAKDYSWELIGDGGLCAGNVMSYAQIGGIIRWGKDLLADWGPELIRPGYSGTTYFSPRSSHYGFNWFLGVEGRAFANNIFLQGNNFQDSRSVQKEYFVADLMFGSELIYRNWVRLGYTMVLRSPEFRNQRGMDLYSGVNASILF